MGTRKTEKILGWIDFENAEQCEWALGFLSREHGKAPLPGSPNLKGLQAAVTQMQWAQSVPTYARALNDLDKRMRRAWDEQLRRRDPHSKAYQFRMSKQVAQRLAWLRTAWKEPISAIVEALIEDAYRQEKDEREKIKARKRRDKHIQRTSLRLLRLENQQRKSDAHIQQLEQLVEALSLKVCEKQHRLQNGLGAGEELEPVDRRQVSQDAKETTEAYLERVRAEVNLQPDLKTLSKESKHDIDRLELAHPKPDEG